MLLKREASLEAIDLVEASDFYRPQNATIFAAISKCIEKGIPIDYVTVSSEAGDPELVSVLSNLQINTPSASNVAAYASLVYDKSQTRRLFMELEEKQTLLKQGANVYEIAASLERVAFETTAPMGNEPQSLTMEELAASITENADAVIPGMLDRDWRTIIVAPEGMGKALDVDTPILTSAGWDTMGGLMVGDEVFGANGKPTKVVAVTEPFVGDCYELVFSDGARIVADVNHLWLTDTLISREATAARIRKDARHRNPSVAEIRTTREIAATLYARNGHAANHSVDVCSPLEFDKSDLPIPPYTFGAWLGDGHSAGARITCADPQIVNEIQGEGIIVNSSTHEYLYSFVGLPRGEGFATKAKQLGVLNNKHIPTVYKYSSIKQRLALLQGLMDTDGTVGVGGNGTGRGYGASICEFCVTNETLANDVLDLVLSLGIKATMKTSEARLYGRVISNRYRIQFQTDLPVFRLQRKLERLNPLRTKRSKIRYIKECNPVGARPVRCIQVENDSGMFVVGRELIPTHNSTVLRAIAMMAAQGVHPFTHRAIKPIRALIVDLENPKKAVVQTGGKLAGYLKGYVNDYDPERLRIYRQPQGIDLRKGRDRAGLQREIAFHHPDLVCIGPVIKMYQKRSGESYEDSADAAMHELDELRIKYGFALLLEHHAAKGHQGQRELTPFGSQRWMSWPDAGKSLYPDKEDPTVLRVGVFRGDRLDDVLWPDEIIRHRDFLIKGRWKKELPRVLTETNYQYQLGDSE
jgi:replicative DNA helicase